MVWKVLLCKRKSITANKPTLHTKLFTLILSNFYITTNTFTMVALDDMTSNIPDLVVPEGNDEVYEQATGYVNAVYFTNWYTYTYYYLCSLG